MDLVLETHTITNTPREKAMINVMEKVIAVAAEVGKVIDALEVSKVIDALEVGKVINALEVGKVIVHLKLVR